MTSPSEALYTIKTTLKDLHHDSSGALQQVQIAGTYTDLTKAKEAAKNALYTLGYSNEDLTTYIVKDASNIESWSHGDGVLVHAAAPSGEQFSVCIETSPNTLNGNIHIDAESSKLNDKLTYVLQTTIHYDIDASGAKRETTIEGIYLSRPAAVESARKTLLEGDVVTKESFKEWDEFEAQEDWSWGEDVVVHAVAGNGQNFEVSVIEEGQKFSTTDSA
ncbi:hypothetical protein E2P81_ATG05402 [Venturia nashicola]|uniref:Uncharacterized protein n=1 Tax=Venturia nashicola TaxID=86259 RepID=A0A4Z1PGN0_9PEZI|nr:hypothetical protein E6O75_ATG05538 [Venturia nashicola]TLD32426.1 hypothetical protein E2P81_ATG05402 [Venturia nashicola]